MTVAMQQLVWAVQRLADAFHDAVHTARDADAALALTTDEVVLENGPGLPGARSADELRRLLAEDVLPHLPADLAFARVSRTADVRRLVDERMVSFTHDRELPWLLPGAAPTGRRAEVLAISVVAFRHRTRQSVTESLIASHRTLWDRATLLYQLRLDPAALARRQPARAAPR